MTVGDRLVGEEVAAGDRFPVGMRILAVDDDQTCLKVLESLLRKCQYHVTTTTQSIKALEMLRKNRHMFDLVISDVNMPDMDGFKLLEQVGLEMDLPVIMLSEYGDKERVMKGVIRGACDYLMKPVRIEELRTIWQHVVRKKIDCKDQNKVTTNEEKICNMAGVGGEGMASENIADQNKKVCQKRKEQSEEEEEDGEENGQESEEPTTGKKPRLVWDAELHRKFVAAVNQLGLDKAFPKKILDLMNVEGLTRENVASHLQKYRLSLKKPTKQASMVAALGYSNPYLQMGLLGGYRDLCTSSGSRRILSSTLPSYASGGIFCGLNSPSMLNLKGMNSSALVQPVQSQNIRSSIKEAVGNIKLPMYSANQSSNLLQGIQTSSMEVNQFQQNHYPTGIRKLTPSDYSSAFSKVNNYLSCRSSNHLLPQGNFPLTHNLEVYSNHSSVGGASMKTEYFNPAISGSGSSNILDYNLDNPLEVQCQEGLLGNIIQASCYPMQHTGETSSLGPNLAQNNSSLITQQNEACFLQRMDSLEGLMNSFMPLDDIICEMVKQDESETKLIDREMEFDAYPAASDAF